MKDKEIYDQISSIRSLMERSTKFISLNGLSGIMAGAYALIGAGIAYDLIYISGETELTAPLTFIALLVLVLSISTGIWLTIRKARRKGLSVWNQSSQLLLINGAIPLLTGGCFALILLYEQHYGIIAPCCLVFYGLALVSASQYTFGDVKWLGIFEVLLGLAALLLPGYGLLFWTLGFGLLHILYGTIMHFKYDRESPAQ